MPVLSFKVDPLSAQRIREKARAAKSSVSAYLRKAALGENERKVVKIVRRKHPVSGLPHNSAGTGRLVTDEEIRAALADYP
jgi:hypothetical protein